MSKINDSDLQRLAKNGEEENYAADRNIGKQGIEGYYEKSAPRHHRLSGSGGG
ncbi:hypothetical protein LNP05_18040 [Klebsiella pneumoniae subsp. pneumoniae]|nr:hypothetical protein [Klebsiella pneumoniae subsp. pneumoniae]